MSAATLASLQAALAEIYDLPATPDVVDYLMTDRAHLAGVGEARNTDEQLIVAEEGDTLSLALYIDARVLARLARRDPFAALTQHNLADYLTVAEGVSHFVYVAWNAGFDKPVTLLELELQAESTSTCWAPGCCASRADVSRANCIARCSSVRASIPAPRRARRVCIAPRRSMPRASAGAWPRTGARDARRHARAAGGAARFYRWGNARKLRTSSAC
jgi:hypothetical protein